MVEIRLDAGKFLQYRQRAVAQRAATIGAWEKLLNIIGKMAVITNAFIISVTSDTINKIVYNWSNTDQNNFVEDSISFYETKCFPGDHSYDINGVNVTECGYYGYRNQTIPGNCSSYEYTTEYYTLLITRFVFVLSKCLFKDEIVFYIQN